MTKTAFRRGTPFCDCDDPQIRMLSQSIVASNSDQWEATMRLFDWVRNRIIYQTGMLSHKASETLAVGTGCCFNKTNLLVALLRAADISAGYCIHTVKGQDLFGPVVPTLFNNLTGKRFRHAYCCAKLGCGWRYLDPSENARFIQCTGYISPLGVVVKKNESSGDCAFVDLKPIRRFPDIDIILALKQPETQWPSLKIVDLYLDFLHQNKTKLRDADQTQTLFLAWLRRRHPFHFCILQLERFKGERRFSTVTYKASH